MTALVFFALLLLGIPIAITLAVAAVVLAVRSDNAILLQSFGLQMFTGIESYGLLAIPLFMLVGEIMHYGGITVRLVRAMSALIGEIKGGLAYVNLLANTAVATIIGSAIAQIALMSRVMAPEMRRNGYSPELAAATTAAGGLLSPIIPPSMILVIYGVLAQVSIADMFKAGIIPGLLMLAGFLLTLKILSHKQDLPMAEALTRDERLLRIREGVAPALVPVIIIGSIVSGLATPTEAAALAAVAATILGFFHYGELTAAKLWQALVHAGIAASAILFLIACAGLLGWVMLFEQLPQRMSAWLGTLTAHPFLFLLLVNLALLLVGAVLDGIPAMIMIVPILLPVAVSQYGIDPLHFGIILAINLVLGLLTPPVGAGLYVAASAAGARPGRVFLAVLPFLLTTVGILVLLSWQPQLITLILR